ncbi:MAG: S24 family peptidase [Planctomycetota bacterium]|jgi:transcriptional regulator with XRE-family HTH domain
MASPSDNDICRRIAQVRLEVAGQRGKAKFAKQLGLSPSTYDYYESSRVPPASVLVRVAEVGGVDIGWLLTGKSAGQALAGDHPIVRRVAALLDGSAEAARPLAAFIELLGEAYQVFPGVAEPAQSAEPFTLASEDVPGLDRTSLAAIGSGELIPILGRSAAGVPQFWSDGDEAGLTALSDLIERHVASGVRGVQPAVTEDAAGRSATQIVTVRADPTEGPCQFIRADAIKAQYPDAFALQIDGESMAPEIAHGDWVILSPSAPAADGRAAVVQLAGQIGVSCKLYRKSGEDIHLVPILDELAPLTVCATEVVWALRVLARVQPGGDGAPSR